MSTKITEEEIKNLLKKNNEKEFKPFLSTRVLARLEKEENIPIFGILIAKRIYLKQYLIAACVVLVVLFSLSIVQEGSISLEHLLGLGNFSEDDILNYTNPII